MTPSLCAVSRFASRREGAHRIRNSTQRIEPVEGDASRDAESALKQSWWSRWCAMELVATFVLFAGVMHFIYLGPPDVAPAKLGLPGHDSFYHVKMAELMPEIGFIDRFPWLGTTIFNDRFVNHHYGFQWMLSPMVRLAKEWTGDAAAGGRWFMTVSFGLSMAMVQLLLMIRGIRYRWIWLALCLLLPSQFYSRHSFIRAINPSLICMLLLCLCLFTRRYIGAAAVIAVSIHVYLGAVMYAPALVAAVFVSGLLGVLGDVRGDDLTGRARWDAIRGYRGWRLAAWAGTGWCVGLAVHPYGGLEILKFLQLQVFGSGLTPDIPVGREWKSYTPAWFFVNMSAVTLTVTGVAVCMRMRWGPKLDTNEFALLLINVLFLVLTLKARRFVEYWPVFAMLSSAYLLCPVMGMTRDAGHHTAGKPSVWRVFVALACLGIVVCIAMWATSFYVAGRFLAEWRWWMFLASVCALPSIGRCWTEGLAGTGVRARLIAGVGTLTTGVAFCVVVGIVMRCVYERSGADEPRMAVSGWWYVALGWVYFVSGWGGLVRERTASARPEGRWRRAVLVVSAAGTVVVGIALPAGAMLVTVQNDTRCYYDLPALRALMRTLESVSDEGAVVFTDDWDVFPVYFYLNHHNHYVVGLDPKFTHAKDPELWERYVRISRGQAPWKGAVDVLDGRHVVKKRIDVRLTDIRDRFHAEFVIVDRDHDALAKKLDAAKGFAERIFPKRVVRNARPPYTLYRIVSGG